MSLIKGVTLSVIEEHLAVLYVLTIAPDYKLHKLERVLAHGRACARRVMTPWYETYGDPGQFNGVNHDADDRYNYHAFDHTDVEELAEEVIAFASLVRPKILADVALFRPDEIEHMARLAANPAAGKTVSPEELAALFGSFGIDPFDPALGEGTLPMDDGEY